MITNSILIPFFAMLLTLLFRKNFMLRKVSLIISSIALFIHNTYLNSLIIDDFQLHQEVMRFSDSLTIAFSIEKYGIIFALLASFLWIFVNLYSFDYMDRDIENTISYRFKSASKSSFLRLKNLMIIKTQAKFFSFMSISIASTMAIAFADNLFTMFIFYEILTISTYPLVSHYGTEHAQKSGRKYLILLMSSSLIFFLPMILILSSDSPSLQFESGGIIQNMNHSLVGLLLLMAIFGIGKSAIFPFHSWLPGAMVAPAPVSAILHAVAVVKSGIFVIVKTITYIFGVEYLKELSLWSVDVILYVAMFTVIYSSVIAASQSSIKKMLAFSTISQLSLCIFACFTFSNNSSDVSIMHMLAHSFAKITLFLAAGNIYICLKITEIKDLNGLFFKMPLTAICFFFAAASIIGLPIGGGFISKIYMVKNIWIEDLGITYLLFMVISSFLSAYYFLPILRNMFFYKPSSNITHVRSNLMNLSILVTTILSVASTFFL